ncbi:MAG TPA: aminotransferase class III-fold pyridoxal phosphate-dependent enzyme [Microthrixaceae bacterium]|nr:aminotransferase class III-fold pyridoxal phosphate-dependent enzyme [Microthrixaceae bacterium]
MSHLSPVWTNLTDLDVVSGEGCWITSASGERYLDFTAGIAVTSTGHCHPTVVEAIRTQAGRFIHAQVNCYRHDLLEPLAARLADLTPAGIDTFFFSNSGAEAVEAAVKLAKHATGKSNIIVMDASFHGRTHLAMAMTTSKTAYRRNYAPLPAGIHVTPFPRSVGVGTLDERIDAALAQLRRLLTTQTAPQETAAIILEPVLGEGGYEPAPVRYVQGVRAICDEHDLLLIADEVQTGFGRTGTMFAMDQTGVTPDIIVMAKGFASGFPISAIGSPRALMDRWITGTHGGTYGGNPLGCAAALATIEVVTAEGFLDNVNARGEQLRAGLRGLAAKHPNLVDVRGPGLMVAAEFRTAEGEPDAATVTSVISHAFSEHRVLLMNAGTDGNVIRFMSPLIVSADEIDLALAAVGAGLASAS